MGNSREKNKDVFPWGPEELRDTRETEPSTVSPGSYIIVGERAVDVHGTETNATAAMVT